MERVVGRRTRMDGSKPLAIRAAAALLAVALMVGALVRVGEAAPAQGPSRALDLTSLEKRLRETRAIGVFTKLSLKNQVDDLLDQFRAFHQGRAGATSADLRERFDLLVLKVLSLVQDRDPVLARDIARSREAIWSLLLDPVKFVNL